MIIGVGLGVSFAALMSGGGGGIITPAEFTERSTLTFPTGETITLSEAVPSAYDANGFPAVRSDRAFNITAWTPAAATDGSGYDYNGIMDTPQLVTAPYQQGFDEYLAEMHPSGKATQTFPYGGNIALPYSVSIDQTGTLVKGVRDVALPSTSGMSRYLLLTVFNSTQDVPDGFFAPAYNDPDAEVVLSTQGLKSTPYLSNDLFDGYYTKAEALAKVAPFCLIAGSFEPDNFRRIMVTEQKGYGSEWGYSYGEAMSYLHSTASDADKQALYYRLLGQAVHTVGLMRNEEYFGAAVAGQYGGTAPPLALLAFATRDSDLLSEVLAWRSNVTGQARFFDSADVGYPSQWPLGGYRYQTTPIPSQVGEASWYYSDDESKFDLYMTGAIDSRYVGTSLSCRLWETTIIGSMVNGPNGRTGGDFLRNLGAEDATNDRAAVVWVADESAATDDAFVGNLFGAQQAKDVYLSIRGLIDQSASPNTPWPTVAEFATGSDGEIDIDLSDMLARDHINPLLELQVRVSQDAGVSGKITDVPVGGTGIIAIPASAGEHYVQMRARNLNGWGVWSYNYPLNDGDSERNVVTCTDTGSNTAPVQSGDAGIFVKPYQHPTPYYEELTGTAPDNVFEYIASPGYVTMKPLDVPTVQWYDGDPDGAGVVISGATSAVLRNDVTQYDGVSLYCVFTYDNGVGSALSLTVGPVVGGGGEYGVFYPSGTVDALPDDLALVWDQGGTGICTIKNDPLPMAFDGNGGNLPYYWQPTHLDILGEAGVTMPEGQARFRMSRLSSGSTRYAGLVLRASGASAATADGVIVEFAADLNDYKVKMHRVEGGVLTDTDTYSITGNGFDYHDTDLRQSYLPTHCRIDWREEGGVLVARAKIWRSDDDVDDDGDIVHEGVLEPAAWDVEHSFADIPTGEKVGFGQVGSASRRVGPVSFTTGTDAPLII